jgi:phenylacetate-CoA ligase
VLTRPGNLDVLTVQVEAHESTPADRRQSLAAELAHHVHGSIGVTVQVEVVDSGALERSLGKAKRISDRR